MNIPKLYLKHHLAKDYTSIGLFRALNNHYHIETVLYPGCYVHITPSLIFPYAVYVDSFKGTDRFFSDPSTREYINQNKEYDTQAEFQFLPYNYSKMDLEWYDRFDLIISQYGGFVGQETKACLKSGGILVCNNSHGDASLAFLDEEYELVGTYRRKSDQKFIISQKNLENHFIPKNGSHPGREYFLRSRRGITNMLTPSGYIFRKR